jgi:hypothetical protein
VTRSTSAANTGGVFGTFVAASLNGLVMDNVYLNVAITGSFDNAGAVVGQGSAHYTLTNVVTHFEFTRGVQGNATNGAEIGSVRSSDGITSTFNGTNNIFLSSTSNNKGTWPNSEHGKVLSNISESFKEQFVNNILSTWFVNENDALSIIVNQQVFEVINLMMLATPMLELESNGHAVTWMPVDYADGYVIFINGTSLPELVTETVFDIEHFDAGIYTISVRAVSDNYVNSDISESVIITIAPRKIDTPVIEKDGMNIIWQAIANATGYQLFINDEAHGAPTNQLVFSFEFFDPGIYEVKIRANADQVLYAHSDFSNTLIIEIEAPELPRLSTPELTVNGTQLSWNLVENAVSYQLFVNGIAHGTPILNESFDFDTFELGQYIVVVQAIADPLTHLDSIPSEAAVVIVAEMVTTAAELRDALQANKAYVMLSNDIVVNAVWTQVSTVFTGVLDGNGFSISNLYVEGSRTGMFRTLGNGGSH